jgi:hypothetical protein
MDPLLDDFLRFSEVLTGVGIVDLRGTGNAQSFLDTVADMAGSQNLEQLLAAWRPLATLQSDELAAAMRRQILGDERLGPVARNILKLWFIGTWDPLPASWHQLYGGRCDDLEAFNPSANAYIEGLLWPTIGASPMGAKAPGYGTWQFPPKIHVL